MDPQDILAEHDKFLDSLISVFEDKLKPVLSKAQKATLKALEKKLSFASDGTIEKTPANQRVLRSVARIFQRQITRAGYDKVVTAFTDQFADHLPKFQKVLNDISDTLATPLPEVKFTGADIDLFASQALGAKDMLLDVVDATAAAAKRQALFNVGGMKFSDLVDTLASQFDKTLSQAKLIADTSVSALYRTIADQSYKQIEKGLPEGAVFYQYLGPDDQLTRPFCEDLLARTADKPMTREEINDLDNGSGLPVWTSGGGWNCRHTIVLAVPEASQRAA